MASPPRGPVPTRTSLRTRSGRSRAISWGVSPPRERPKMSTDLRPRPSMKLMASAAMPAIVCGAVPVLRPTPALSSRMISRPGGGGRVADGGVEVVEVAHEVLGEDQRGTCGDPEAAVSETSTADFQEPGESGRSEGSDHGWLAPGRGLGSPTVPPG